jgi:uncharacterized protein (TIGR03118 family)
MFHLWEKRRRASAPRQSVARRLRPQLETLEDRTVPSTAFIASDLVSDQSGVAPIQDTHLVNGWGIALSQTGGAFWVSSNGEGLSTLYTGDVNGSTFKKAALEVTIPNDGAPTGQVFNTTANDFRVSNGTTSAKPLFIFASETGTVTGWAPSVAPATSAHLGYTAPDGAVYKGLALASNAAGNFLFATDFHNAKIDVLDTHYNIAHLDGSFTDPNMEPGYAPFNIALINGKLYVTYALQDDVQHDDVPGPGHGFIDVFDTSGHFQQRLVSHGALNSPWGMALAPASFGDFSNDLIVGNFGDGFIHAYNPSTGAFVGTMTWAPGRPVVIDGLWGLAFGNGVSAGDRNTLYYAAGPDGEAHGLFGKITANPIGTNPVKATLTGSDLIVTGSRNDDLIQVSQIGSQVAVIAGGQSIGSFPVSSLNTIRVSGLAGNDIIIVSSQVTVTTILDGGAGNDILLGGGGSNILLGGDGNDLLIGAGGPNLLIGGDGQDSLIGGNHGDLLIAGQTAYDSNQTALLQILNIWRSADTYTNRIATLRAGTGVPKLDSTTVFDDGVRDLVVGGAGLDWFWVGPNDLLLNLMVGEQVN